MCDTTLTHPDDKMASEFERRGSGMKNRWICIFLAALLLLTAAGCGNKEAQQTAEPAPPAQAAPLTQAMFFLQSGFATRLPTAPSEFR